MHSLSSLEVREVDTQVIRRARLAAQTRVYVKNSGRLFVGRIMHGQFQDDGLYVYQVQFPNNVAAPVPEQYVKVRCLAPMGDPTDSLMSAGMDSQFVNDRRTNILEHVVKGRAGSRSFAGLLSSSVELYPHQLEVVRRVSEDALQRYLLADEVGLGKTIEAGGIIRQHLLENPDGDVLVLAPDHIVGQWQTELTARFHLDDFGDRVRVVRHGALASTTSPPTMLVVDEVHHLVGRDASSEYQKLSALAHAAPRLILISHAGDGRRHGHLTAFPLVGPGGLSAGGRSHIRSEYSAKTGDRPLAPGTGSGRRRVRNVTLRCHWPQDPPRRSRCAGIARCAGERCGDPRLAGAQTSASAGTRVPFRHLPTEQAPHQESEERSGG